MAVSGMWFVEVRATCRSDIDIDTAPLARHSLMDGITSTSSPYQKDVLGGATQIYLLCHLVSLYDNSQN